MRNLFALILALVAFTGTVVAVNAQGATPDAAYSFDIREAVERVAVLVFVAIDEAAGARAVELPYAGVMAIGAFVLALPAIFTFAILGRLGR